MGVHDDYYLRAPVSIPIMVSIAVRGLTACSSVDVAHRYVRRTWPGTADALVRHIRAVPDQRMVSPLRNVVTPARAECAVGSQQ